MSTNQEWSNHWIYKKNFPESNLYLYRLPKLIQIQLGPAYVEQNHNGEGQKANLH